MTSMPQRPRLRKREIAFALAMGVIGAGGAGIILAENADHERGMSAPVIVEAEQRAYAGEEFDEISTVGPQDIVITYGETFSVRGEGSPEALAQLIATVEGDELIIRPRNPVRVNWGQLASARFHVTLPGLKAIAMAGSGEVSIDRIEGDDFEAAINGSGDLRIGDMRVNDADFAINGSGSLLASGLAQDTRVSIGGTGRVRAAGLRSEEANVSIAGTGTVALTVQDEARISVMGPGNVEITGSARCTVSKMGPGNVSCGNVVSD